jgi:Flp pilus assembly protein TadD
MWRSVEALVMRAATGITLALVALVLFPPELKRYAGERRQGRIEATLSAAARGRIPTSALGRLSVAAEETITYPGDWRPLVTAGRASYAAGDYSRAVALFQQANTLGERPEVQLNLGAAWLKLGDQQRADAAFARAIRVAPGLEQTVNRLRTGLPSQPATSTR